MAEEKHRMLYQGQDPSQPVLRAQTLTPQQPPTYDDAMGNVSIASLRLSASSQTSCSDRRRTFFAEPQHLRSQQQDEQNEEAPNTVEVQQVEQVEEVPVVTVVPVVPPQQHTVLVERVRLPQVRSFFALMPQPKLGGKPCTIVCPACGQQGRTRLRRTPNTRTHCLALCLCSFGWCCCACLYPYLMDNCRTTSHYCSLCKTFVGAYYPKDCCL